MYTLPRTKNSRFNSIPKALVQHTQKMYAQAPYMTGAMPVANDPEPVETVPESFPVPNEKPPAMTPDHEMATDGFVVKRSCIAKGLDNVTRRIEQKVDKQILVAQMRAYDIPSRPTTMTTTTTDLGTKHHYA